MIKASYLAILIILVLVIPVSAIENSDSTDREPKNNNLEQKVEAIEARQLQREQKQTQRCEIASGRLASHAEKVGLIFEKRTSRYDKIITRLKNLSARLENNQTDTTEIDAAINELSKKISEMDLRHGEYLSANNFAINISCTDDGESIKEQIPLIRSAVKEIRVSDQLVRDYITDIIRPLVELIKAENKEEPSDV